MNEPPAPPDLSQRLAMMLTTLRAILAARGGRDRSVAPLVMLAWNYLSRLARRFEALAQRVRAGDPTLLSPRARAPRAAPAEPPEPAQPRPRPPGLPRNFAWMVKLTQEAAIISWALKLLLNDPEFAAFLAAAPQAARLLRPLCRGLGISRDPDLPAVLLRTPGLPRPNWRPPRRAAPAPLPEPEPPGGWPPYPGELTREDVLSWPCFRDSPA